MAENTVLDNNMSPIIKKKEVPKLRFPEFNTFWDKISFNDIFDILQNNTYTRADLNYKDGNTKNIHYGDILIKFDEYINVQQKCIPFINGENTLSKFKAESYLKDGDIIIADTAEDETVGKVTEISNAKEQKILSGLHTIPCRPKRKFAPMFLGFYMNSKSFHKQLIPLITGIKVSSISKTSIATTTISVPTFEEQEKISKFLVVINKMIKEQESNISILETYNRGLLNDIFEGRVKFKNKDGEKYPDWEEKILSEEFPFIRNGFVGIVTDHFSDKEHGVRYIEGTNIHNGRIDDNVEVYVTKEFHQKHKKNELKSDDIVMVQSGHVGDCAVVGSKYAGSNCHALIIMSNGGKADSHYVAKYFLSDVGKKKLEILKTGNTVKHILSSDMNKFKLPFPCLEEQQKIADCLSAIDKVLQQEKVYLEQLKTIKKGLLQQMFV
ncbi:MAG: hypothetical protein HDQ96_12865 [Lachnospiraceae bacterium]|nr:hypothetical protein [Lachnospiraceae bacterium]